MKPILTAFLLLSTLLSGAQTAPGWNRCMAKESGPNGSFPFNHTPLIMKGSDGRVALPCSLLMLVTEPDHSDFN